MLMIKLSNNYDLLKLIASIIFRIKSFCMKTHLTNMFTILNILAVFGLSRTRHLIFLGFP